MTDKWQVLKWANGWMDRRMGGVWMKDRGPWLSLSSSLKFLKFLGECGAFTLSSATVPVITLRPWCPCNKMMINDREGR